jgi:large subunit ribosomal protein L17
VTALFEHKKIHTTEAKAKELRPIAERIITKVRKAYVKEQQGLIPEGNKSNYDLHVRRQIAKDINKKPIIEELFDEIIPEISDRPGGYTRIVKTGFRRGDGGSSALIMLVDFFNEQEGPVSLTGKKKKKTKPAPATVVEQEVEVVVDEAVEEAVDTVEETTDEVVENTEEGTEAPVAESTDEAVVEETTEESAESSNDEEPNKEETNSDDDSSEAEEDKKEDQ